MLQSIELVIFVRVLCKIAVWCLTKTLLITVSKIFVKFESEKLSECFDVNEKDKKLSDE